jgi:subtilisin family serine protease
VAYTLGQWYGLKIEAVGNSIKVYLDDALILEVVDGSLSNGKIGLYCWSNEGSEFDNVRVIAEEQILHCYFCPQYDYGPFTPGTSYNTHSASFEAGGCRWYRFNLTAGHIYTFTTCEGGGSYSDDTVLTLYNGSCGQVATNDDYCSLGSQIEYTPTSSGDYYMQVRNYSDFAENYTIAYKQVISPPEIRIEPTSLHFTNEEEPSSSQTLLNDNNTLELTSETNNAVDISGLTPSLQAMYQSAKLNSPASVLEDFIGGKSETRIIVILKEPVSANNLKNLTVQENRQRLQGKVIEVQNRMLSNVDSKEIRLTNRFSYIFGFSAEVSEQGLQDLIGNSDVLVIEKDEILHAQLAQGIPLMNASTVRNTYNGSGISIAICDTGIDYTHPNLGNGSFPNSKVIGGYDTGENDNDPMDGNGHGTACAGISAGNLDTVADYIGGVAYNAKLYALKITYNSTVGEAYTSDMVEAWEWCITHQNDDPNNPIMIISTSFGGGRFFSSCDSASTAMTTAAANAVTAGITLFAASGNEGFCDSIIWPACISHVISVGAVYDADIGYRAWCIEPDSCIGSSESGCQSGWRCDDPSPSADDVICYSNSATFLDLFAPSLKTYTTDIVGSGGKSSGDYYSSFGGTSAATPYAAGAGASLQSAAQALTGSFLTPAKVRSALVSTGDPITDGKVNITKPRVNLGSALDSIRGIFTIYNDGGSDLVITSIVSRDDDPWLSWDPSAPLTIPPGGSQEIEVYV